MPVLFALLAVFALMAVLYVLNGWALFYLWHWFIVPLGLPELSIAWAIGIGIVVGFLTNHNTPKEGEKTKIGVAVATAFFQPIIALLIGWIVHQFMG